MESPFGQEESTFQAVYFYLFKTSKIKRQSKAEYCLTIESVHQNAF